MPLSLAIEQRNLQNALWQSSGRLTFSEHVLPASRIADIPVYLRRHMPHILHFAGHGDGDGGLLLNAPSDKHGEIIGAMDMTALVRDYQAEASDHLGLVILAGCQTDLTARLLANHVDCVVGFSGDVDDDHLSQIFTPQLYAALGDGRSVVNAVDIAISVLRGHNMGDTADMVRMHVRPDVNQAHLYPASWVTNQPSTDSQLPLWVNVPPSPNMVVGRATLLEDIVARLIAGRNTVISIEGPAGVGKTTLALLLAYDHRLRVHFNGGVLWARLGRHADVASAQATWAKALKIDLTGIDNTIQRQEQIAERLAWRRTLVVLDDVWEEDVGHSLRFKVKLL